MAAKPATVPKTPAREPDKAAAASVTPVAENVGDDAPAETEDPQAVRTGVFSFCDGSTYRESPPVVRALPHETNHP